MKTVQLLGGGMTRGTVPPVDPSVERWACNGLMVFRGAEDRNDRVVFDAWDRWFDFHRREHIQRVRPVAYDWYRQQDARRPIYLLEPDSDVAGWARLPVDTLQRHFASHGELERDFWGTLPYMIALALYEGFEAIELFWFPFDAVEPGWDELLECAKYWIGVARGRGVKVTIHGESRLKPGGHLYGAEAVTR